MKAMFAEPAPSVWCLDDLSALLFGMRCHAQSHAVWFVSWPRGRLLLLVCGGPCEGLGSDIESQSCTQSEYRFCPSKIVCSSLPWVPFDLFTELFGGSVEGRAANLFETLQ